MKTTQALALFIFLPFTPSASLAAGPPLPESPTSEIGYPSPEAALAALRKKPGVTISAAGDWTIANDPAENALWSFTNPGLPAHPSAVKRTVVDQSSTVAIDMKVMCGASKEACDQLVREFSALNERILHPSGQ